MDPLSEIKWPFPDDLKASQSRHHDSELSREDLYKHQDGWIYRENKKWLPEQDLDLIIRFIIAAHVGSAAHSGVDTTSSRLQAWAIGAVAPFTPFKLNGADFETEMGQILLAYCFVNVNFYLR